MRKWLTVTFVFCSVLLFGQASFKVARIVDFSGDTLHGFINYKYWDINPKVIEFRTTGQSPVSAYSPLEVISFSVEGEDYKGAVVDVDSSSSKVSELSSQALPLYRKDTVFLHTLVTGEKQLFFLRDKNGEGHFYISDAGNYIPLVFKKYIVYDERLHKRLIAENEGYKKTLTYYFSDCPDIASKIQKIRYSTGDLVRVFSSYYACTGKTLRKVDERRAARHELGFLAGGSLSSLHFKGSINDVSDIKYENSLNPTVGVFFDMLILRSNKWRVSNKIFYSRFQILGTGVNERGGTSYYTINNSFDIQYLKSHHTLEINLIRNGTLSINAGISSGMVLSHDIKLTRHYTATGFVSDYKFDQKNYEFGLVGGIGFSRNRLGIELSFENSTGFSNYANTTARTQRLYLFLKYRINSI